MVHSPPKETRKPTTNADRAPVRDSEPRGIVGVPYILRDPLPLPKFGRWARHRRLNPTWQVVETYFHQRADVGNAARCDARASVIALMHQIEGRFQVPIEFLCDRFSCDDEIEASFVEDAQRHILQTQGGRDAACSMLSSTSWLS